VQLAASGPDADAAIATLAPMLRDGLGETGAAPPQAATTIPVAPIVAAPPAQAKPRSEDPHMLLGVTASPGLAAGQVYQLRHAAIAVVEQGAGPEAEQRTLQDALGTTRGELEALQARVAAQADANKAAIFAAHAELIADPDLLDAVNVHIRNGKSAAWAWQTAVEAQAAQLSAVPNEVIAQRANDLRDVGRRVLEKLAGVATERRDLPANTILIAEDLTPSDTATLDRSRVLGFATTLGGATSHVAILARSLDMPAIAGVDARALDVPNGTPVILDGSQGHLRLNPSLDEMTRLQQMLQQQHAQRQHDRAAAHEPAITMDGQQLEIVANISGLADAEQAVKLGGEGVGLLRTEFLFGERSTAPTEDEQADVYASIARTLGPTRPLIIRTLDIGGDKPLPYVPIPPEANPFLGERGIRIGLNRPELLRTQVRAILRAAQVGNVLVMFPMIATLDELQMAKRVVEEARVDLGVAPIPVGIMVEVPAVAVMAEQFAREADFFSIGTNDLTQYTLAMDRGHPKLASQIDGLNPAVLQLIALTVAGARKHGKWVGVCGGIAGDAQAVPLLVGMGVKELSVSVPAIPAVKAQIRTLNVAQCQTLAAQAVAQPDGAHVRALVAAMNGQA
jgi:phosphocarrier protein FPr